MRKYRCYENGLSGSFTEDNFFRDCCPTPDRCPICPPGPQGPVGPNGELLAFADFFALLPPDSITVAPGADVAFPRDGVNSGTNIARLSDTEFALLEPGVYLVQFQLPIEETGQVVLTLNGTELPYTVARGTDSVSGIALVETTVATSVLTLANPASADADLVLENGTSEAAAAHLVITQLQ